MIAGICFGVGAALTFLNTLIFISALVNHRSIPFDGARAGASIGSATICYLAAITARYIGLP